MPHILTNNTHNFDKYINPNQICEISECMPVLDPLWNKITKYFYGQQVTYEDDHFAKKLFCFTINSEERR
jgi:hypothetical protein